MQSYPVELLMRPESDSLRFLPEGPYAYDEQTISWVAIQHGAQATSGSLNLLNLQTQTNRSIPLSGRPGFAFPTDRFGEFVIGMERSIMLFDIDSGHELELCDGIDANVSNTIINDGVLFDEGIVFGCKDLEFESRKAGLYLWRSVDQRLITLRDDQICSNGKVIVETDQGWQLYDIDSPTKTVVRYSLDVDAGLASDPETVIDLSSGTVFPDGMVATPDEQSVIIAFYNPQPAEFGEARQYRLADGQLEAVWQVPASPQVTCPQLIEWDGEIRLVLTTAVEHMSAERQAESSNAGCLFVGSTPFEFLPPAPVFSPPEEG